MSNRRRTWRTLTGATSCAIALVAAGCGGGGGGSTAGPSSAAGGGSGASADASGPTTSDHTPTTVTVWSGFTNRELGLLNGVLADFHRTHPWITVKSVGGIADDKIEASIRSGNAPDVAISFTTDNVGLFCNSKAWLDLAPYIARDKLDVGVFPKAVAGYTQYQGDRCALPVLADTYGLYYNKAMFAKAGITAPPKTFSELTADAKKLTVRDGSGAIKVAGFDPYWGFYENAPSHYGPLFGASWVDGGNRSALAANPGWARMITWQKSLVDWYGADRLVRFNAGAGDEFSASNAFETGKVAMAIDGEYRTAFLKAEHPELAYGAAPMPVDDAQPTLYGAGYITGTIAGLPKNAKHKDQGWQLLDYLATDTGALVKLGRGLANVPTTQAALAQAAAGASEQFKTFLAISANAHTTTTPINAAGSVNQDTFQKFLDGWQRGQGGDPTKALAGVDKQIDAALANASGSQAP